ncbi:MAG: AAA family ATPase [Patescibacteria group bacterium]|nr:AAA family ATPase [Patescibacteria group bacterium]
MLLKRLELQGFKSFADKTSLDLDGRVISIVGPNGSGKSNVTDALRWILGERDAKNLRSSRAEDLIFAGTQTKPRAGLAQATLYFDNSTGFFPVDFNEVSVSRRVSRDGATQIFLNKSEIRLKDIIDFFAKSRLGARGLTTVNQGESDIFIRSLPIERRMMIEEILGLKEFRLKKAEAERKLKNSELNLEKAAALIEEIKPHLNFLRRQVTRYNNRENILESLRDLENKFYGSQIGTLNAELQKLAEEAQSVEKEISVKKKEELAAEEELNRVKSSEPEAAESLKKIRDKKNKLLSRRGDLQRDLGKIEAKLELSGRKTGVDAGRLLSVFGEIKELIKESLNETDLSKIKTILSKVAGLLGQAEGGSGEEDADIGLEKEKLLSEIKNLEKEIEDFGFEEDKLNVGIRGFNEEFSRAFTLFEEKKREIEAFTQRLNRLLLDKEKTSFRLEEIKRELSESGRDPRTISASNGDIPENEKEVVKRQIMRFRQELASIGDVDQGTLKEAEETESRHGFLVTQIDDLDKSIIDLKALIKELDGKIHDNFVSAFKSISEEFDKFIKIMFDGGNGKLILEKREVVPQENEAAPAPEVAGVEIEINLPKKRIKNLEVLSGGEKSLVSIAALFALVSVSPPPFLVLDEIDATLDERNARRLGQMVKRFATKTQFIIVTHNRAVMEVADMLYGVTMTPDGTSRILSLKLSPNDEVPETLGEDVHEAPRP